MLALMEFMEGEKKQEIKENLNLLACFLGGLGSIADLIHHLIPLLLKRTRRRFVTITPTWA